MGVGLPFGVGAKVACPDKQVIVVHGEPTVAKMLLRGIGHRAPFGFMSTPTCGQEKPSRTPTTMAIKTWTYSFLSISPSHLHHHLDRIFDAVACISECGGQLAKRKRVGVDQFRIELPLPHQRGGRRVALLPSPRIPKT